MRFGRLGKLHYANHYKEKAPLSEKAVEIGLPESPTSGSTTELVRAFRIQEALQFSISFDSMVFRGLGVT